MASEDNTVAAVPAEPRPTVATKETSVNESPSAPETATTETCLAPESSQQVAASASGTEKSTKETIGSAARTGNPVLEPSQDETRAASSSIITAAMDTTNNDLATDIANDDSKEAGDDGPSLVITLLLITGARHPFKIDGRYLRKRAITVENHDPFNMSVYTLKELIWREWRSDWEPRPSSPSAIRLISFGKLLDDKSPLSDSRFSHDAPNVVHMTVKPQEVIDEEDAKASKSYAGRDRDANERTPRCHCVIL